MQHKEKHIINIPPRPLKKILTSSEKSYYTYNCTRPPTPSPHAPTQCWRNCRPVQALAFWEPRIACAPDQHWTGWQGFFVLISFHMFQADLVNIIKTDLRNKILKTQHSFLPHHVDVKFLFWGEVSMLDHVRCWLHVRAAVCCFIASMHSRVLLHCIFCLRIWPS